jgi:hypothetical protein
MSYALGIPFLCLEQILQNFTLFWISYFAILKHALTCARSRKNV